MSDQLIFIYNADSGIRNSILDSVHKITSPSTYTCELCFLTYGIVNINHTWKQYLDTLDYDLIFLHKDELDSELQEMNLSLPTILLKNHTEYHSLVTSEDFAKISNIEELISIISLRVDG